jgi:hypothetical protein
VPPLLREWSERRHSILKGRLGAAVVPTLVPYGTAAGQLVGVGSAGGSRCGRIGVRSRSAPAASMRPAFSVMVGAVSVVNGERSSTLWRSGAVR